MTLNQLEPIRLDSTRKQGLPSFIDNLNFVCKNWHLVNFEDNGQSAFRDTGLR